MKKYKLILIAFVLFTYSINAQSVEELVDMATTYNPGLKSLRMDYAASLLKADQVNDWPDPMINLGIGVFPVETRLGAQRLKIGVIQMIPWKGSLDAKSNVAKSMAEVQSYADEVKEIDIEYAIRTSYAMLQFLESKKGIISQRLEILNALEDLSKSAVRSGKGKLSNVLFTERRREILKADLSLIAKKMDQPTIMINRWTGRPLMTEVVLPLGIENQLLKNDLIKYAENDHPQFRIFENQIAASNAKITVTEYDSKPKIGLGLDYAYIDARNDVGISGNGRDALMPMASVSIPIHKGKYKAIRQEETIRQEAINAKREEVLDMFEADIELAYASIEYTDQVISKYQSLKIITRETLKLMRSEYATDGTRFEELLRLEMELIDYDHEILKSQYQQRLSKATLFKFN
ncbi:MAG: cobalt-zinc-cadmium efflux system outer membrane protein [Saprospiraceae bacterium]|jgi:cobalt-zinc-cadmium efflux system outer membrane protein